MTTRVRAGLDSTAVSRLAIHSRTRLERTEALLLSIALLVALVFATTASATTTTLGTATFNYDRVAPNAQSTPTSLLRASLRMAAPASATAVRGRRARDSPSLPQKKRRTNPGPRRRCSGAADPTGGGSSARMRQSAPSDGHDTFAAARRLRSERAAQYTAELRNSAILEAADVAWKKKDDGRVHDLLNPIRDSLDESHRRRLTFAEKRL